MGGSQNDTPASQPAPTNIQREANVYEDEINLLDYLRVLWKRKYFIILGSVLPALVIGLAIFVSPRNYKVTYTYDIGLDEKGYKMLLDRFYSAENLDKLAAKLKENGFDKYAQEMSKANIQLEIAGTLLTMSIVGKPQKDVQRISSIVRDNFEKVIPIYNVKQELSSTIIDLNTNMSTIEDSRFRLGLEL